MIRRKLRAMRKANMLLLCIIFFSVLSLSLGYSVLNQNLMVTGDVSFFYNSKRLYDVLLLESRRGTLAEEYTGDHQDSVNGNGTYDIFHWYAGNDTDGTNIQNKNNVIFAGQCWQIIRTTDTGGVKLIYNGVPENNQCLNTRTSTNHTGYYHDAIVSQNLASAYYYGTDYTYNASTRLFTLAGNTESATWSAAVGPAMVGKYTCLQSTASATCSTLYLVESYQNATNGSLIPIVYYSDPSRYGIVQYSISVDSPSYVGYMYNMVYQSQTKTLDTTTYKYAADFTYSGGTYTLGSNSVSFAGNGSSDIASLSTHHYTCWNTTGTCSTVSYVYYSEGSNLYYINLTSGKNISEALTQMFSTSPVNKKNSMIKTAVDAWYAKYLNGYSSYLEDTIFCNNRSITSLGGWDPNGGSITGSYLNFGSSSLSCTNPTDRFSTTNSLAKLKYNVGLMTNNEMYLLGNNNARATGINYLLLTPDAYGSASGTPYARIRVVSQTGSLGGTGVGTADGGVRPVVSLVYGTEYTSGTGTMADSYIVSTTLGTKQYVLNYDSNGGSDCSPRFVIKNENDTWGSLCTPTRTGYSFGGWYTRVDGTGVNITSSSTATSDVNVFAKWVDNVAPQITSLSASTTTDLESYINFTATDSGSKVSGYNITTSSTAPTAWIPVVSAVATHTETKYEYSAAWARVFHHNNHWGSTYFSSANSHAEAKSSNTIDKYSVLGNIDNYKFSSKWELLLKYPDVSKTLYNRWTQTGNPVTSTIADGDGSASATGYTAVHIDWSNNYWGGLTASSNSGVLMDGSTGHSNTWYSIGATGAYQGGMPGPNSSKVSTANLWARIDGLTATTLANLTRRIGGITENDVYYVWVKDAVGNTAYQSIEVTNIDYQVPTADITFTSNTSASITMTDNGGLAKYYFGTTNPASNNVTYTSTSGTSKTVTQTVDPSTVYYLSVVDIAGNRMIINSRVRHTLTYNNNGGDGCVSEVQNHGIAWGNLCVPTRTGYNFEGWNTASDGGGTTVTASSVANSDLTVYAQWVQIGETQVWNYSHRTSAYTFTAPYTGDYRIELWGANTSNRKGAYTYGTIHLTRNEVLYVYVGSGGNTSKWNGGGGGTSGHYGGGATDVRLVSGDWNNAASLRSRIMVAGGAGGIGRKNGGNGGLLSGAKGLDDSRSDDCQSISVTGGAGGTQTTGNAFGTGANSTVSGDVYGGAGGGGYWGGKAGASKYQGTECTSTGLKAGAGGGGGSSYISGHKGYIAVTSSNTSPRTAADGTTTCTQTIADSDITCSYHYSGKIFIEGTTGGSAGANDSSDNNGHATITFLNTFTITYDSNGGSACDPLTQNHDVAWGTLCVPTRSGYTLAEWNTKADGTGTTVLGTHIAKSNLTVYAIWQGAGSTWTYSYTGTRKAFRAPSAGNYKIELWGAQGKGGTNVAGKGAYVYATLTMSEGDTIHIYVGGQSKWNGGGGGNSQRYGGDATDVRFFPNNYSPTTADLAPSSARGLRSRIMVAGGGGGQGYTYIHGGNGGLINGSAGSNHVVTTNCPDGGVITHTETGGKAGKQVSQTGSTFGIGADATTEGYNDYYAGGGGGGYWGGGKGNYGYQEGMCGDTPAATGAAAGGGGGSSYISGITGYVAVESASSNNPRKANDGTTVCTEAIAASDNKCSIHYTGKIFNSGTNGGSAGNRTGTGYARITKVS